MSTITLASRKAPLGIGRCDITRLWFWHCRICPGWPTVGHDYTHDGALAMALRHAAESSGHRYAAEDLSNAPAAPSDADARSAR